MAESLCLLWKTRWRHRAEQHGCKALKARPTRVDQLRQRRLTADTYKFVDQLHSAFKDFCMEFVEAPYRSVDHGRAPTHTSRRKLGFDSDRFCSRLPLPIMNDRIDVSLEVENRRRPVCR